MYRFIFIHPTLTLDPTLIVLCQHYSNSPLIPLSDLSLILFLKLCTEARVIILKLSHVTLGQIPIHYRVKAKLFRMTYKTLHGLPTFANSSASFSLSHRHLSNIKTVIVSDIHHAIASFHRFAHVSPSV